MAAMKKKHDKHKTQIIKNDPQNKHRLETVSKNSFILEGDCTRNPCGLE